ncbi:MAG: glycine cleavage system protein GcvH [Chloroflexota bacterium]|nr:glycine cleavage system protein GcvH [Chloroflexota bacterium]MDE2857990.1 glycine cleavage system protein GcvH [Chloroflexota bacterium]MDE2951219.1 glycine cleavage system protein GcvH [Chloroflexota bacterium]
MGEWKVPAELRYAETDEWFAVDGDVVTIGITDYAQDQLNDIVYVEFRDPGDSIDAGDSFGEVESVKAASELYSAVDGEIIEVNAALEDSPEIVNADPFGAGWMVKIRAEDLSALQALMDAAAYDAYCDSR